MATSNRSLGLTVLGVYLIVAGLVHVGLVVPGIVFVMGILALIAGVLLLMSR